MNNAPTQALAPQDLEVLPRTLTDAERAELIVQHFNDARSHANSALDSLARANHSKLLCGQLLLEKGASLEHGDVGPWLAKHCAEVPKSTAYRWMTYAKQVAQKLEISHDGNFDGLTFSQVLSLPAPELSELAGKVRAAAQSVVEDYTQAELFREFSEQVPKARGGARVIRFTCPHCSTPNKAKIGTDTDCQKCGRTIRAKNVRGPNKGDVEKVEMIRHLLASAAASMQMLRLELNDETVGMIEDQAWASLSSESRWLAQFISSHKHLFRS